MNRYRIALVIALTTVALLLLPTAGALAAAKPTVSLKAAARTATIGQTVLLKGVVGHPKAGVKTLVILEQSGKKWLHLATAKLTAKHAFAAKVALTRTGSWRLLALYKAGSMTVRSKVVVITVNAWAGVSCGQFHTMALKTDGTLWAWGANDSGQLGLKNTAERNSPTQVEPGSTWKAVSCGQDFTLAIKSNGTLWAWGDNSDGQLGLGTADNHVHPTPAQVGTASDWTAVSCGYVDTLAVQSNGTLWGWGSNGNGELGVNNTNQTNTPTQVGSATTWTAVSCGNGYTLAIQRNGTLWGSGDNMRGQLGLGVPPDSTDTMTQVGSATTWPADSVSGTDWYTLAIQDGTLWAFGHNDDYQLGLGSNNTNDETTPTQVGTDSTWKAVSGGGGFNLAVKADGSLWSWGYSSSGNLGLGHMSQTVTSPTRVGTGHAWTAVSCGYEQTMVLRSDGTLWACGDSFWGDLGLGNTPDKDVPTEIGGAA